MSKMVRKRLIPLLAPNLRVVFVGTEPGKRSLLEGRYYADPSNSFYVDLRESDWTPGRALKPEEFRELLLYGIGLDDVYYRPDLLRRRLSKRKTLCGVLQQQRGPRTLRRAQAERRNLEGRSRSPSRTIRVETFGMGDSRQLRTSARPREG